MLKGGRKMTNKNYAGYDIRSGFLGGNIIADDLGHERPVNLGASCARYAKLCREAIEAEYPGADVTIGYEVNASGGTPCTLETSVLTADGTGNIGAYGSEANSIADHVDDLMGHIWEAYEWVVYEEAETDDELTDDDKFKLGHLATRNEAGTHFTQVYSDAWLQRMERLGWISIHRPVHGPTSIPYSQDYWAVEVNEEVSSWFDAYGNLIGSSDKPDYGVGRRHP